MDDNHLIDLMMMMMMTRFLNSFLFVVSTRTLPPLVTVSQQLLEVEVEAEAGSLEQLLLWNRECRGKWGLLKKRRGDETLN